VPKSSEMKNEVLREMHNVPNSSELKKCSAERNSQCAIGWASRISEADCSYEETILLDINEERHG
jgi:hypothetical protein